MFDRDQSWFVLIWNNGLSRAVDSLQALQIGNFASDISGSNFNPRIIWIQTILLGLL
jgi:hypothetical protein